MANKWKAGDYMGSGMSKGAYLASKGQTAKSKKSSGKSSTSSQYDALMKKYEKTLKPSSAETAATKQLSELTQSSALGVAKQGQEVMPMNVITGSQANIQEQAALKATPLKDLIAAEQAKRGAASDVLTAQTGLLEKKMAAEQTAANAIAKTKGKSGKSSAAPSISKIIQNSSGWQDAYETAKALGIPTNTGSPFDIAANKFWKQTKSRSL